MIELIVTVLLQGAAFFFDKNKENKELAKLIAQWISTMRKRFAEAPAIYKAVEDILKQADEQEWVESK